MNSFLVPILPFRTLNSPLKSIPVAETPFKGLLNSKTELSLIYFFEEFVDFKTISNPTSGSMV